MTRRKTNHELRRGKAYRSIAASLREFGYPDVTAEMVKECVEALEAGKDAPHGVIGKIIKSMRDDCEFQRNGGKL